MKLHNCINIHEKKRKDKINIDKEDGSQNTDRIISDFVFIDKDKFPTGT